MSTHIKADRLAFKTRAGIGKPEFIVTIYVDESTIIEADLAHFFNDDKPIVVDSIRRDCAFGPTEHRVGYRVGHDQLKVLFNVIEEACRFNPGDTSENLAKFLADALGDRAYRMGQWITEEASSK